MPDQLCLSLWLRGFDEQSMLRHFRDLLRLFPFSQLRPGIAALRIYALEFAEPGLVEQGFAEAVDADTAVQFAGEFEEPDCAYLIDGWWELWRYGEGWQLTPSPVVLACFAPRFENEVGDHLRLELGPEESFLPVPGAPQSARRAHSNLQSLVRLAQDIAGRLPVERQKLWAESGEDFAERLDMLADEAG